MALDDRDRIFEKALARHLRSSAPSGVEANAPAGAPLESCPDPEILAAYHERSLSSGELNLWEEHVVACGHCQFVLAQLVATDNIALDASPAQNESLISELAFARKQHPAASPATDSRSIDSRPVNSRPIDSRPVEGERRRPPSWRWVLLIPAGAIAASLVAWVSLRTPKPLSVSPSSPVQVAENQPAPSLESPSKPALIAPSEPKEKDQPVAPSSGAIGAIVAPNRDAAAKAPQNGLQLSQQTPNQFAAIPAHGPSVNQQKQQQQQYSRREAGSAGAAVRKKLEEQAPAGISENAKSVSPPSLPPPPQPSEPSSLDQSAAATPSPGRVSLAPSAATSNVARAKEVPKEKAANAAAISAATETVEVTAEPQTRAQAQAMLRAAALQNPHVFVAPDGKHLWRVGPSGSLDYSKDKGLNWTPQTTGVNTDLSAGSAVSAKVAWVVGNSGTVLRTTDGGAHWTKLDSPVTNDLSGVRATDAFHASIWFVPDPQTGVLKTYETEDGGATWSAVPNQ
ncbi:MAG: hypothetical protein WA621_11405 [Candidatus Acidiferrum sp.]